MWCPDGPKYIDPGAKTIKNCTQECKNTKCLYVFFQSLKLLKPSIFAMSVSWKPCRTIPRDVQKDCPASKVLLKVSTAEKSRLTGQGLAKQFQFRNTFQQVFSDKAGCICWYHEISWNHWGPAWLDNHGLCKCSNHFTNHFHHSSTSQYQTHCPRPWEAVPLISLQPSSSKVGQPLIWQN